MIVDWFGVIYVVFVGVEMPVLYMYDNLEFVCCLTRVLDAIEEVQSAISIIELMVAEFDGVGGTNYCRFVLFEIFIDFEVLGSL